MECNSIRSEYKWDKLGFGCSVSHSRKGREGLSLPGACSSPARRRAGGGGCPVVPSQLTEKDAGGWVVAAARRGNRRGMG